MKIWCDWLQINPAETMPFLDIPVIINPLIAIDREVIDRIAFPPLPNIITNMCICYLKWVVVERQFDKSLSILPKPYEPLIRLFERGGTFRVEHGMFIDLPGVAIPVSNWHRSVSTIVPIELDDASLDTFTDHSEL